MLTNIELTLCVHYVPFILFTSSTSRRHRNVDQHLVSTSCQCLLFCLHRPHRNVDRYRIDIVSRSDLLYHVYFVNIVDIAKLTNIVSLSCAFFFFRSSTSQCGLTSSQRCVYIVPFVSCLHCQHCRHRNTDQH